MAKGEQGEMMSDLVERLRKQSDPEHRLFDTAADEIEHLRAALERIANDPGGHPDSGEPLRDIAREALK